jgi:MFS superfamily sulfate permease-like transporter
MKVLYREKPFCLVMSSIFIIVIVIFCFFILYMIEQKINLPGFVVSLVFFTILSVAFCVSFSITEEGIEYVSFGKGKILFSEISKVEKAVLELSKKKIVRTESGEEFAPDMSLIDVIALLPPITIAFDLQAFKDYKKKIEKHEGISNFS